MIYIVDRIENNIAILENKETKEIVNISLDILPSNLKEGNVLKYENNIYTLDKKEEEERKKTILDKFNKLKNKDIH
ncbi:MAG: DUF3006 domain-containing protein [Bacilli bacterium]|nr:DUF3006 domain-containing protein [Bacilli bacterium]